MHIVRLEQLYPFPEKEISVIITRYKYLKEMVWVQEEPRNMGAWTYVESRIKAVLPDHLTLTYIGRPLRSSPAEGLADLHNKEQQRILSEALNIANS